MRISRRTSGGRGEYEISEASAEGITPSDLLGRHLKLDLGDGWIIDTGCTLTAQGGKRRIRMSFGAQMHPHLQLAAALMMPHPVRADEPLGSGVLTLKSDRYAIEHIEFSEVQIPTPDTAVLSVSEIILRNVSYHAQLLNFYSRRHNVAHLWAQMDNLPDRIAALLRDHQNAVTTGPVPKAAAKIVEALQEAVTEAAPDLGIIYRNAMEDVVPDLMQALNIAAAPPETPVPLEQIEPEEIEIRRRTVKEWKRWANSRGAASAKFRQQVRKAYNSTCLVCGLHLPATDFNAVSGVDAAHILPWAQYDLDHLSNGLSFCKHHHWAFDEGLIRIEHHNGQYSIVIPDEIVKGIKKARPDFSIDELLKYAGEISEGRLPKNPKDRPNPKFLQMLSENE